MDLESYITQLDVKTCFILLIVPVILLAWVYYGKRASFGRLWGRRWASWDTWRHQDLYGTLYEYMSGFVLMFVVPFVTMALVFQKDPRELGLQLGDTAYGWRVVAIGVPLALLVATIGSAGSAVQAEYPQARSTIRRPLLFLAVEACYLVYYLGWEYLFRGFMLFGLAQSYDPTLVILVQTIPSALVHIGKPAVESFAAILAGIAFGYIALRTRSILYPLVIHAAIGIALDVSSTLRQA
jgi:membrane protease YdiL (CAAX protease family)